MKQLLSIVVLSILLVAPLRADQDGIIVRTAPVHDKADYGSRRVGQIKAGVRVSIMSRQGGWKEIFSEQESIVGWVRSYQVREAESAPVIQQESASDSRGFLAGLASFSRKASSFFKSGDDKTSSGTATIGVRGLSEDEIKTAQPDFQEFEEMKRFASNSKRAASFSRQGGLTAIKVPHIRVKD
jgi:hypothetical protein